MCKFFAVICTSIFLLFSTFNLNAFEIIRDVELENYTKKITSLLLKNTELDADDINYYFIKSNEVNAFVTGGKNLFLNTELILTSNDYREYLAVIAHELSHILGGHIFRTSEEISRLSQRAFPVHLLSIIALLGGSADAGLAGLMIGSASVQDGYTYYSRNQEASADQAAIKLLCNNQINAYYFLDFLNKLERISSNYGEETSYRSTHPLISARSNWITSGLKKYPGCDYNQDVDLQNDFDLLKAKLFGFTHPKRETLEVYKTGSDIDKYARAVTKYFAGEHKNSIRLLKELINDNKSNPYFKELLGEIYFSKQEYHLAIKYQLESMSLFDKPSELYLMMMGNYYIALDEAKSYNTSIKYLKESLIINPENSYSWYLLAKAYAGVDNIPLAQYASAERYYLIKEHKLAYQFALKSIKNIQKNTPEWYRTNDLLNIMGISNNKEDKKTN